MRTEPQKVVKAVTLAIRKGSVVAPLLLMLITILLFVIYALPSEHAKLASKLGLTIPNPSAKDITTAAGKVFGAGGQEASEKLWAESGNNFWTFAKDVVRPLFKAYVEQFADEFKLIVASVVGTILTLALYSLGPGLAGLIYRRQFTIWFLASFTVLMAINASGLFPSLAGNVETMPQSGQLLIFLLSQLVILLLAFRLRRETTSASIIPPTYWNWGLTALLVLAGLALSQFWHTSRGGETAAQEGARLAGKATDGVRDCETCPALKLLDQPYPPVPVNAPPPPQLPRSPSETNISRVFLDARQRAAALRRDQMKLVKVPLYVTLFEVTRSEWDACRVDDPSACQPVERVEHDDRLPVAVTFAQAKTYAAWLSRKTGATYRLASPVEWEYAARANAPFGLLWAHGNEQSKLREYAWFMQTEAHHVGRKKPNAFGLFDMHGNIAEWVDACLDPGGSPILGCSLDGTSQEVMGGNYGEQPHDLAFGGPTTRSAIPAGIRLVREAGAAAPALAKVEIAAADGPAADSASVWALFTTGFTGWIFKWELILVGLPLLYSLLRNSAAWTERKRKNIVICLDGTSNTPDQVEQGFAATTNVYKLFRMLKSDAEGMFQPSGQFDASLCKRYRNGENHQIAFYYAGVGNKYDNDPILQTLGMATGAGAGDLVQRAYLDLVRVYQTGDRVFIVGFSRGAAISRLLAQAINARGAPRSVWTIKLFGKHRTLWASKEKQAVAVDVLGCWDTVGSFGVAKTIAGINFQQLNLGKDLSVPENVQQAYHMVALDEQRDSFEPTLMDPDPNRPERIVEVWFAGDHANIGGGWATDRLSDITLDFLLSRISSGYSQSAEAAGTDESWGLYLKAWKADKSEYWERQDDNPHIVDPDPLGLIQQWFSHLYSYRPRKLPQHAVISDTVFKRMVDSLPLYAPQALFNLNDDLHKRRELIDGQMKKLQETKLLSDDDQDKIKGYQARLRLNRFEDYWNNKVLPNRLGRFKPPAEALANHPSAKSAQADRALTR